MELIQIEKANFDVSFSIYKSCIAQHAKQGFYQWDKNYPSLETVMTDIENKQLFGLQLDKEIVAVVAITNDEPKEYHKLNWKFDSPYIVIHRLCVSEKQLRKGYAKKLMQAAENFAKRSGNKSVRLDTFSLNKRAVNFYESLNYKQVGKVNFPKRIDSDYTCFEKGL